VRFDSDLLRGDVSLCASCPTYLYFLSLHDALPIWAPRRGVQNRPYFAAFDSKREWPQAFPVRNAVALLLLASLGCSSEALDSPDDPQGPSADSTAVALGTGDGSPESMELVTLFTPTGELSATALAFDPLRSGELWVTLRRFPTDAPCTMTVTTGCAALIGEVALIQDATGDSPEVTMKEDGNAWHFMRRPTSIAFGTNGNLATCGEARTANYEDQPSNYNGPTLWSSDPAIFGVPPKPGQNGTHLDMLHETPFCMGIAHERDNVYWTFNGELGALDRYDFNEPHQIGGEDHADGELFRYVEGAVARTPEIPSHLAYDQEER